MCAIVGSFDKNKLLELINLNSYRGSHSYSFSIYDTYLRRLTVVKQDIGKLDEATVVIPPRHYGIAHIQAPTTEARDLDSIHPALAELETTYTVDKNTRHKQYKHALWHNGILKADYCEKLQERNGSVKWDTNLLLMELIGNGWYSLDTVDGSFSCLYYVNGGVYLFRNEISPMFIDDEMNISSTKFKGSRSTEPNKVYAIELDRKTIAPIHTFRTVENPYFFGEE